MEHRSVPPDVDDKPEYEEKEPEEDEEDATEPVYAIADLLANGTLTLLPITFDTIEPREVQDINIFEYHPEGSKVFVLKNEDYRRTVVRVVFSSTSSIILYVGSDPLTKDLKRQIRGYNMETINAVDKNPYTLRYAKVAIDELNRILGCKDFKLRLDYVYEIEKQSLIYSYDFNIKSLILCLYLDKVCISSVSLIMDPPYVEIESRTRNENEGNKLNKLLRAAAINIMKMVDPVFKYVVSYAIHPISVYVMIKDFGGKAGLLKRVNTKENQEKLRSMIPVDRNIFTIDAVGMLTEFRGQNRNLFTIDTAVAMLTEFGGQITVFIPLEEAYVSWAHRKFVEFARLVRCDRSLAGGRRLNKSTKRQSTRRQARKTKRRVKGRTARRQRK
jgi:hypothetical protein